MPAPSCLAEQEGEHPLKEDREVTVGQYLRQAREQKNIPLESISKVTRISLKNLEALEKDAFEAFPAQVFVRGFLRTYAACINLDPREVIAKYEAQIASPEVPLKIVKPTPASSHFGSLVKYILTLFIIMVVAGMAASFFLKKGGPPFLPVKEPKKSMEANQSNDRDIIQPSKKERPVEKAQNLNTLKIKAIETTWISIQADDQPAVEALLQPQEAASWTAQRYFKLIIGNAGGVEIFFNEAPQGRLGESGQVIHLLLPPGAKEGAAQEGKKSELNIESIPKEMEVQKDPPGVEGKESEIQ